MPRIYVSPSTQERNAGISPFSVEEVEMNKIANILIALLNKDSRFVIKRNNPSWNINQIAADSDSFKADLHLAIHSNAGGGEGTEVYAYGPNTNSERFAQHLYKQIAPLSPGKDRGVKFNKALYEVGDHVDATSALIELGFHDNSCDAKWLATNQIQIAEALYKAICDYFAYDYRALVVAVPVVAKVEAVKEITIVHRTVSFDSPDSYPVDDFDVNIVMRIRNSLADSMSKGLMDAGISNGIVKL